jgi:hypothetical protein
MRGSRILGPDGRVWNKVPPLANPGRWSCGVRPAHSPRDLLIIKESHVSSSWRARVPASILTRDVKLDPGVRYLLLFIPLPSIPPRSVLVYVPCILSVSDYPLSLIPYHAPLPAFAVPVCARRSSLLLICGSQDSASGLVARRRLAPASCYSNNPPRNPFRRGPAQKICTAPLTASHHAASSTSLDRCHGIYLQVVSCSNCQ